METDDGKQTDELSRKECGEKSEDETRRDETRRDETRRDETRRDETRLLVEKVTVTHLIKKLLSVLQKPKINFYV